MKYDRELNNIAESCAAHYAEHRCSRNCNNCSLNLNRYLPEKEATMLKTDALLRYEYFAEKERAKNESNLHKGLVSLILLIAILFFNAIDHVYGVDYLYKTDEEIQEVLCHVRDTIRDVNFDGEINCIDYSVRAYEVLPYSKIMRIDVPWMNHLYIRLYNGRDIEPQHWYNLNFDMYDVWGTDYEFDKFLHRDETRLWKLYALKKEW